VTNPLTPQSGGVLVGIKSDEQPITRPNGRGTQISGWADQVLFQLGLGGGIILHVEVEDFLPFGHKYVSHGPGQLDSLCRTDLLLAGMNLFDDASRPIGKELLRAPTGDSTRAMIVPVDLRRLSFHSRWSNCGHARPGVSPMCHCSQAGGPRTYLPFRAR